MGGERKRLAISFLLSLAIHGLGAVAVRGWRVIEPPPLSAAEIRIPVEWLGTLPQVTAVPSSPTPAPPPKTSPPKEKPPAPSQPVKPPPPPKKEAPDVLLTPPDAPKPKKPTPPEPEETPPPKVLVELPTPETEKPAPEEPETPPDRLAQLQGLLAQLGETLPAASTAEGMLALPGNLKPVSQPEAGIVATYVGGTITVDQFRRYVRALYHTDPAEWKGPVEAKVELAQGLLLDFVLTKMAVRKAEELGLADQPEVTRSWQRLAEEESLAELVARLQGQEIPVSEREILEYYTAHREEFADLPLEQVRLYIEEAVRQEKAQRLFAEYVAELRAEAEVETFYEALENPAADEATPLFTVNGESYTLGEWRKLLQSLPPEEREALQDPERAREVLEELLLRQLLLAEAAEETPDETRRTRLEVLREQFLRTLLHYELVHKPYTISDLELKVYYEAVKQRYLIPARAHIAYARVPKGQRAEEMEAARALLEEVREAVLGGQSLEEAVAARQTADNALERGEIPGWIQEGFHGEPHPPEICPLCRAVFSLEEGGISEPFAGTRTHLYLVQVLELEPERTPTLEELRPLLLADLARQRHDSAERVLTNQLLEESDLCVNPEGLQALFEPPISETTIASTGEPAGNEPPSP
ncbi:MAG TPA: peptidyl-prolyl cis-trans isomerase [Armatimonadetes bacterium]|nr:peptidyl-prolyl cis-trans isomerase [Armatimonadota bacterium]